MQNNHTAAAEDRVRELAAVLNNSARRIFTDNAGHSTPDNAVVLPFYFLVSEDGQSLGAIPGGPSKDLTAAVVRRCITPRTFAVISICESFKAMIDDPSKVTRPVRDLDGAHETVMVLAETRSGLLLTLEQKIDRSGPVPALGETQTSELSQTTGRMAGWFA